MFSNHWFGMSPSLSRSIYRHSITRSIFVTEGKGGGSTNPHLRAERCDRLQWNTLTLSVVAGQRHVLLLLLLLLFVLLLCGVVCYCFVFGLIGQLSAIQETNQFTLGSAAAAPAGSFCSACAYVLHVDWTMELA